MSEKKLFDTDKFFNFVLIFAVVFFTFNVFFGPNKKVEEKNDLTFKTVKSSYTYPNSPVLSVKNNTDKEVKFNLCDNSEITYNNQIINLKEESCKDITVASKTSQQIDYAFEYETFHALGNYNIRFDIDGGIFNNNFKIEDKGVFNEIFTFLFYQPLLNLLIFFINITGNSLFWGIILITVATRLLLVYPQHKSMVSSKKLQKIQPKIKEIQEKHKANPQLAWTELMKLYKEEWVSPMWACLPLLIQIPVFIVVYNILLNLKDPENMTYLYDFIGSFDFATINHVVLGYDILSITSTLGLAWIGLILLVWGSQYLQLKLSFARSTPPKKEWVVLEKKEGIDKYVSANGMPSADLMNKVMLYTLPLMITSFAYFMPAALAVYWFIWTIFAIVQQYFANKVVSKI